MGFRRWLEGFYDYLGDKEPWDWRPDDSYAVVYVEKDIQVQTPKGAQPLSVVYCIARYTPPHHEEPVEIHDVWPVVQFDESYIKAATLYGAPHGTDQRSTLQWAWREFQSNHNHYHLLPKPIKDQVWVMCAEKAHDRLEDLPPEQWEPPED